ncbi:hypothetical protein B0T18DRAFT_396545 [Schizothecium vesticola]|uniref:WW domain-containing protein n=1 Tax=Schizothecium vesticola TaxID=314040 RepID=A0AA40F905_9PEZI|nr:hypothetical protein B0T18DRAFT_396545 [Schizothecium vesticola]
MSSPSRAFDPAPDAAHLDMLSPSRAFDPSPDAAPLINLPSPSRAFDPAPSAAHLDMMSPSRAFDLLPNDANLLDLSPSRAFDLSLSPSRAFDPSMSPSRAFDPIPDTADHNMLSPSRAFDPISDVAPEHLQGPVAVEEPAVVEEPAAAEGPIAVEEPAAAKEPATVEEPALPEADEAEEGSSSQDSSRSSSEDGEIDERSSPEPTLLARQRPSDNGGKEPEAPRPTDNTANPPLPNEPLPGQAPPLPSEPVPEPEDDGWEAHWNPNTSSFWFYNRFTSVWQQENPRVPDAPATAVVAPVVVPETQDKTAISNPVSVAGGYNPAIHGDYDENAWYAQNARAINEPQQAVPTMVPHGTGEEFQYVNGAYFNRWTGQWQTPEQGPDRHTDEAKSKRQMNAYFDVDAAANMHDGRSLKAERANRKLTKAELKTFKEKRKAKKEEKRRAWLRD